MTSVLHLFLQETESLHGFSGYAFTLLLEVTLKGTLFLSVAAVLSLALRRASAASRHLVWTLALGATLALPVLALTLPAWRVPIFLPTHSAVMGRNVTSKGDFVAVPQNPQTVPANAGRQPADAIWPGWILLLWGIGSGLFVARMAVGEIRVHKLTKRSHTFQASRVNSILEKARRRLRVFRAVELRTSTEIAIPFTRGTFRPAIILPEDGRQWPQERLEFVLAHELAHVYRHDCLTQVSAQIACALLWFHPLYWFAASQMRKERERACDDVVLNLGHQAADYAESLLALGRCLQKLNPIWSATVAVAQPSQLEVRMKALLNSKLNHKPVAASRVLFAALLTMALLLPTAAIRATAKAATANNDAGNISGTVLAPGEVGASGAKATLIDLRTLKKISTLTDKDGRFEFSNIRAGGYKLEVTKPGFEPANIPGIAVAPSRNVVVYVKIGARREAVLHTPSQAEEHGLYRIRIGGQVEANKLIYHVLPKYPPLAKAARIQGTVKLDAVIGKDGTVKDLKAVSGHPLLVMATLDAVRKWRFKPTLIHGVPAEVETTIVVNFGLAQVSYGESGE